MGATVPLKAVSTRRLAEILGTSPKTVRRLHRQGRIRGLRLGRSFRFDVGAVLAALEERQDARPGPAPIDGAGAPPTAA